MTLENYFDKFRRNIIGRDSEYETHQGMMKMIYADWIAGGRLYLPIEEKLQNLLGPFVANTHTGTNETGALMTMAYHKAQRIIKEHTGAGKNDVIITAGFGMTAVIVKLQRILGLKICGQVSHSACLKEIERPVVFITHMEHHSNHTSWFETIADVIQLKPGKALLIDENELIEQLEKYKDRKVKIGSFTACSNVTGIKTDYHRLAEIMHLHGGYCFVDFAASAPYVNINMHPENPLEKLDAIFFSPHKFLGGPGSSGVLIFDSSLYHNKTPDQPGGGTVEWTNAWGEFKYIDDIEAREDGGTPGFLQAIRTALCIKLKEEMGTDKMLKREEELLDITFPALETIPHLHILADNVKNRLGVISFYFDHLHYNLVVKLLSDRYGIQMRGGCACAGTYGHYLLDVSYSRSKRITGKIDHGDLSEKPGWVRMSLHPTMTDTELMKIIEALKEISQDGVSMSKDYIYSNHTNEFSHIKGEERIRNRVITWFE